VPGITRIIPYRQNCCKEFQALATFATNSRPPGQKVLERVAVGEHQPGYALGMPRDHDLADGPARVVADQRNVAQIQGVQEFRHKLG
jgi:hypothetical protein